MKLYQFHEFGSLDGLRLSERAEPTSMSGEVLIRIYSAALNFRDLLVMWNQYPLALKPGLIPLSDGAGEVVSVGLGVTRVHVGDRVVVNFQQCWIGGRLKAEYLGSDIGVSCDGVLSKYIVLSKEGVIRLPEHLSFTEGEWLACAGITAWSNLKSGPDLEPGQTVSVQGTGSVAIFALQFAKVFGARVIATTSSDAKADRLRALGADEVINYVETLEWQKSVLDLTSGLGFDRVVEVGGSGMMEKSFAALAIGGYVAFVGFMGGVEGGFSPLSMLGRGVSMEAIGVGGRAHFEAMLQAMTLHHIHPVIDRSFLFEEAKAAYSHLQGRNHVGKVVITVV